MKTVKVSEKGQIAIPTTIRESMGIHKGDELILVQIDEKILLEKVQRVENKLKDDFKDILEHNERALKKIWDNEEDEIWSSYLK